MAAPLPEMGSLAVQSGEDYTKNLKKVSHSELKVAWGSEKAMAPHSSTLPWKIPWMEEPGRLQSMGLRRVGHH